MKIPLSIALMILMLPSAFAASSTARATIQVYPSLNIGKVSSPDGIATRYQIAAAPFTSINLVTNSIANQMDTILLSRDGSISLPIHSESIELVF